MTELAFDATFAALLGIVALAVVTEVTVGFGSILVGLTLGANLYPIPTLLPLLVCVNVMLTSYIVTRHRGRVDWSLLLRGILPGMAVGAVVGYAVFVRAPDALLRSILGVFVIAVACQRLWQLVSSDEASEAPPISNTLFACVAIVAGVFHGIMATGGPIMVYAVNRRNLDKGAFRSTLASAWLVLNAAMIAAYASSGRLGSSELPYLAAILPIVAIAVATGEQVHRRIPERSFRFAVLALLLVAGVVLLVGR